MAGKDNLKVLTPEEARKNGRAGGIASGKARREKKAMRRTLEAILSMPMKKEDLADIEEIQSIAELKGRNITAQEAMLFKMLQKAMKGDVKAAEFIRDTAGEKPKDDIKLGLQLPVFYEGEDELED